MLTSDQLKSVARYNPETGDFTSVVSVPNRSAGSVIGSKKFDRDGSYYLVGRFGDRQQHPLHRVAWLYMMGDWPTGQIDHKNLCKHDNRWDNLRLATHAENIHNRPASSRSKSGIKGVYLCHGRWVARISIGGTRTQYVGRYDSKEEATLAYADAHRALYGEFSRA